MVITTSPLVKTYTLQEFWDLPEPADYTKLELIKGVLYMTPPPENPHSEATSDFFTCLDRAIEKSGYRGKLYTNRAALWIDDTHLEPDLMYISDKLKTQMGRKWSRADIVLEISSPSTALYDRRTKADTYRAMGVRELWLVDPEEKQIEVRSFEAGKTAVYKMRDILRSQVLRKIKLPLRSLFK